MDAETRARLLARYADGPDEVDRAVAEAGEQRLDTAAAGGWTARRVVHHLADSEMTSAIRLRKLLAEDEPVIHGYDEELFADRLFYDDRPLDASLAAFRAARLSCLDLLERLGDEHWGRTGTHTESGAYSVETWLEVYAAHAHDHADQIRRAAGL